MGSDGAEHLLVFFFYRILRQVHRVTLPSNLVMRAKDCKIPSDMTFPMISELVSPNEVLSQFSALEGVAKLARTLVFYCRPLMPKD